MHVLWRTLKVCIVSRLQFPQQDILVSGCQLWPPGSLTPEFCLLLKQSLSHGHSLTSPDEENNEAGHFFASPNQIPLPKTYPPCYRWGLLYLSWGEKRQNQGQKLTGNLTILPPSAHLHPAPPIFLIPNKKRNRNTYIVPTLAFLKRKGKKRRMELVGEEMLEAVRIFLPPGVKVTQTAMGGPRRRNPNAAQCFLCRCSGGSSFRKTDPERRPREQSMLEAPPQLGGWRCRQWQH